MNYARHRAKERRPYLITLLKGNDLLTVCKTLQECGVGDRETSDNWLEEIQISAIRVPRKSHKA